MKEPNDFFDNWTVQVRKGLLELFILNALDGTDCYGYDLVKTLTSMPGLSVSEGTLYPLLSRLRVQGLLRTYLQEASGGPARKYYALTDEGRRAMAMMNEHLDDLIKRGQVLRKGVNNESMD